jgi:hypothetical protein
MGTLTALALTALLLAACDQAGLPPTADPSYPETETGTNPGTGIGSGAKLGSITVTVAAAGNPSSGQSQSVAAAQSFKAAALQSVARTVVPVIGTAFDTFVLTFDSESGDNDTTRETEPGETTVTVKLPPDTYSLKVTGKKDDVEIAVGEIKSVVIAIDDPKEETVDLKPMTTDDNPDLADGVFSYAVTLLDTATKATLTLTDAEGNPVKDSSKDTVESINLKNRADGMVEGLRPGEYRLAVSLENTDETDKVNGDILEFSNEVVYIYSTLTSLFAKDFSEYTLVKTKGPLDLTMSFGPSTVVGNTGTLTFEQQAEETFDLIVPDTFDNVVWYLDGVKLTEDGAGDGVSGNTYTAPGSMLYGTHFITVTANSKANGQTYSQLVDFHVTKKKV